MLDVFGGLEKVEAIRKQPEESFCEFVLGRMGRIESARAAIKQRAIELNRQLDSELGSLDYIFGPNLHAAADNLLTKQGGKKKSVKLLTGTVGYSMGRDKLVIDDMEKAIAWCAGNSMPTLLAAISKVDLEVLRIMLTTNISIMAPGTTIMINLVQSINVTPLFDYFKETGDIPDGCTFIAAEDKFYAKPCVAKLEGTTE